MAIIIPDSVPLGYCAELRLAWTDNAAWANVASNAAVFARVARKAPCAIIQIHMNFNCLFYSLLLGNVRKVMFVIQYGKTNNCMANNCMANGGL